MASLRPGPSTRQMEEAETVKIMRPKRVELLSREQAERQAVKKSEVVNEQRDGIQLAEKKVWEP